MEWKQAPDKTYMATDGNGNAYMSSANHFTVTVLTKNGYMGQGLTAEEALANAEKKKAIFDDSQKYQATEPKRPHLEDIGVKMDNQIIYLQKVMTHINLVRQTCLMLNENLDKDLYGSISEEEIKNHDASKFSEIEIKGYTKQFYTDDKNSPEWQAALMHHYKNNPHHWQYWLKDFTEPYTERGKIPLDMPREQILIMVADWLAAGYQYQGITDISKWLNGNYFKLVITDESAEDLTEVLYKIGYAVTDNDKWFLKDADFCEYLNYALAQISQYNVK
jgi:hypothetical protein